MKRAPVILLFALCLAQGAVKVGVFPAEVKRSFTVGQGLPDDRVRCVAVAGARVFAGTSKGLAVYAGESWKADPRFAAHAVEACAAAGDTLYFHVRRRGPAARDGRRRTGRSLAAG